MNPRTGPSDEQKKARVENWSIYVLKGMSGTLYALSYMWKAVDRQHYRYFESLAIELLSAVKGIKQAQAARKELNRPRRKK